jgi:2',3'-cyclic-nucleotide 2'-phosphodiesterase (5'-nucleotidase family)
MGWGRNAIFALIAFGVFTFGIGCKVHWAAVQAEGRYLSLKELNNDEACLTILKPFSDSVANSMGLVLCHSAVALPKVKGQHETALGNLMSDIILNRARLLNPKVQVSLLNLGGIRASLPHGPITLGDVYSLMPFDNRISILQLGPQEKKEMFRYIGEHPGTPFSGFELRCLENNWTGLIHGLPIPESDSLVVVTTDFLAQGGDKMNFFLNSTLLSDPGLLLRDGIIAYMVENQDSGKEINSQVDHRILPCLEK